MFWGRDWERRGRPRLRGREEEAFVAARALPGRNSSSVGSRFRLGRRLGSVELGDCSWRASSLMEGVRMRWESGEMLVLKKSEELGSRWPNGVGLKVGLGGVSRGAYVCRGGSAGGIDALEGPWLWSLGEKVAGSMEESGRVVKYESQSKRPAVDRSGDML
ncbi:hypothetical protein K458DRAFT_196010 [Lentithecium fluviatile CBS 122367]|uniref:Uncharacterized protein n=1 Tax=Lentithecium fluviatile CBS 122367 TaxID=1168545 RepID=A0A6G1ICJ4_9PLEO|nr:hypothetical protein K458DRAFT_196010 [Lentithecium fluviatile CBS 122367]